MLEGERLDTDVFLGAGVFKSSGARPPELAWLRAETGTAAELSAQKQSLPLRMTRRASLDTLTAQCDA